MAWQGHEIGRRPPRDERGFTLVELMVVIVIMGLLASVAVLALPDTGGSLRGEAERFAARAKAAQEAAVINARSTSLSLDPSGYAVARSEQGAWQEIARYGWSAGTSPEVGTGGQLRTVFDATGIADPLEVTLRRGADRVQVDFRSDGTIQIRR
jgi:general secretion pathway protein H